MIFSFFESFKYVGHLWPIGVFRFIMGYHYFSWAMGRYRGGYFEHAYLNEKIRLALPSSLAPDWYQSFLEETVQSHWLSFTYVLTISELLIGLSFLLGYLVRPFSILGVFLSLNFMWAFGAKSYDYYQTLLFIHLSFLLLGAGRCLGFDYYFYKSRRGIWW